MNTSRLLVLVLAAACAAHADFRYTSTRKAPSMPGAGLDQTEKHYFKGDRMLLDSGITAIIIDFDAQTVTNIDRARKSYTVSTFADVNGGPVQDEKIDLSADFKETGQHKTINGFNSSEAVMTVQIDTPQQPGTKMEVEIDIWFSPDVPGYSEMEAFYKRNMSRFPWGALTEGANASVRAAMTELQKKMAAMHGAPVLEVIRTKMGGSGVEITSESSDFSVDPIPDWAFEIPAGFRRKTK